jgi:hypothetical protein
MAKTKTTKAGDKADTSAEQAKKDAAKTADEQVQSDVEDNAADEHDATDAEPTDKGAEDSTTEQAKDIKKAVNNMTQVLNVDASGAPTGTDIVPDIRLVYFKHPGKRWRGGICFTSTPTPVDFNQLTAAAKEAILNDLMLHVKTSK